MYEAATAAELKKMRFLKVCELIFLDSTPVCSFINSLF